MIPAEPNRLIVIRHAPADSGGRLAGRRDVAALLPDASVFDSLRAAIGPVANLLTSPALRCVQTADALFPGQESASDPRLWEQDFGDWEGADPATLPNLGPLPTAALAAHCPPGGESFATLCARTHAAIHDAAHLPGTTAIVAHAGTARACLALALGDIGAGLAFEIAPLSHTAIHVLEGGLFSVAYVNRTLPA